MAQAARSEESIRGLRVEIPRWSREPVPLAQELARGAGGVGRKTRRFSLGEIPPGARLPGQPEPLPPFPPVPPVVPVPPGAPPVGEEPPGLPPPAPRPTEPTVVQTRIVAFHFSADITSGAAASELRVFGPLPWGFRVREIHLVPLAGVTVGQYVDVLVSADLDTADVAAPSGVSILRPLANQTSLPSPDNQFGVAVPLTEVVMMAPFVVRDGGSGIKVRQFFTAPAIGLADLDVVVVVDEFAAEPLAPIPTPRVVPMPPTAPAPAPEEEPPIPAPPPVSPVTTRERVATAAFLLPGVGRTNVPLTMLRAPAGFYARRLGWR